MFGIDDTEFIRGDVPMTKQEIRVLTLAKSHLTADAIVADIGAGTGSITVVAALIAVRGKVVAVERKLEAIELIKRNVEKFSVANVEIIRAIAPDGLNALPELDAAIVGGPGGQLDEILSALDTKLKIGGRIVVNAVTIQNVVKTLDWFHARDWLVDACQIQVTRLRQVGQLDINQALNPVWIIAAEKIRGDDSATVV